MPKRKHAKHKTRRVQNDDEYNAILLATADDVSDDSEEIYYRSNYKRYRPYYKNQPIQNNDNEMLLLENDEEEKQEELDNLQEHKAPQTPPRQFVHQMNQPLARTSPTINQQLVLNRQLVSVQSNSPSRLFQTPPRLHRKRIKNDFATPSPDTAHDLRFALAAGEKQQQEIDRINNINRGSGIGPWNQNPPTHVKKYRLMTKDDTFREINWQYPSSWIEQVAQPWGYTEDTEEDKISEQDALAIQAYVRQQEPLSRQQQLIDQQRHPSHLHMYKALPYTRWDGTTQYIATSRVPTSNK